MAIEQVEIVGQVYVGECVGGGLMFRVYSLGFNVYG